MNDALREAATAVLEEMTFALIEPDPDEDDADPRRVVAEVPFAGARRGRLRVEISDPLLPTLAANMLGEDGATRDEQLDALREIANVICGNVLPALVGPRELCRMSAPSIVKGRPRGRREAEVEVPLVGGVAVVALYLDP